MNRLSEAYQNYVREELLRNDIPLRENTNGPDDQSTIEFSYHTHPPFGDPVPSGGDRKNARTDKKAEVMICASDKAFIPSPGTPPIQWNPFFDESDQDDTDSETDDPGRQPYC